MRKQVSVFTLLITLLISTFCTAQNNPKTKPLTSEDKTNIVETIYTLLNDNYVFPEVAAKIEEHLKVKLDDGAFDQIESIKEFSERLTTELQSVSHDKHIRVREPMRRPSSSGTRPNPIIRNYQRRKIDEKGNFGFAKLEKLEENVGYVEITGFPPLSAAKDYADMAMKFLSTSDALIFDLRRNGGGSPDLINYICSYLFEKPTHINSIYNRVRNTTRDYITFEKVDGKKMSDVPVFLLTSDYTFSGGEEFAYNIQTQKRGVLIGETTGGGANPGGMFPITPGLGIFIPTGMAINPITKTNWEGVGVVPDIKVEADKALEEALPKAREAAVAYRSALDEKTLKLIDDIYNNLTKAEALFTEKKFDEAEILVESALNTGFKNILLDEMSMNMLGYEKMSGGNLELATAIFKFITDVYPESANAFDSLGEAYMNAGDKTNAVISYNKSLELDPGNTNAAEQLKKLGN